jgi:hypothetical protein
MKFIKNPDTMRVQTGNGGFFKTYAVLFYVRKVLFLIPDKAYFIHTIMIASRHSPCYPARYWERWDRGVLAQ